MSTIHKFLLFILLNTLLVPVSTAAGRHPGANLIGMVRQVDATTRTLVIIDKEGNQHVLRWLRWVRLGYSGGKFGMESLKPGMRVSVSAHNPLFGPDYVTKVTWLP
ncbi:hypothetical protein [Prosthecobacter sp.]|jgi:hypothetical protein|uniref:hypothetical protein n=1 Tax=Prosthecobacter sp. TaxID=1965333 RepID=UPI0037849431